MDPQALVYGVIETSSQQHPAKLSRKIIFALRDANLLSPGGVDEGGHQAYADPIDGGWAGYQAACHDCDWRSPNIHDDKSLAQDEAGEHFYKPPSGRPGAAPQGSDGEGESCDRCGQPYDYVWWCHDPSLWATVSGNDEGGGLLCIPCFDRRARDLACWVEWSPLNLRHLERHPRCAAGAP